MVLSIFLHVLLNFTIILAHVLTQAWREAAWALSFSVMVHIPSAEATGLEKASFHSKPKKGNAKECSNYCTIVLISHASKAMLKILKLGFSSMWTEQLTMCKLDLEKAEEPEIKLPTAIGS